MPRKIHPLAKNYHPCLGFRITNEKKYYWMLTLQWNFEYLQLCRAVRIYPVVLVFTYAKTINSFQEVWKVRKKDITFLRIWFVVNFWKEFLKLKVILTHPIIEFFEFRIPGITSVIRRCCLMHFGCSCYWFWHFTVRVTRDSTIFETELENTLWAHSVHVVYLCSQG